MIQIAYSNQPFNRKLVLIALMTVPLISVGCNRHNAPTGQTVATVNDGEITTSDMQLEMENLPQTQRKQAQPLVVQTLVDRKVLSQYAKSVGIDRNPDYVLQLRRITELLLADRAAQQIAARARQPVTVSEINKYLDAHPSISTNRQMLTLDQLTFPFPSAAISTNLKLAKTLTDVIEILQKNSIKFTRDQAQVDTAGIPDDLNGKLKDLPEGEPLVILNSPNSTANVIVDRKSISFDAAAAADIARQRITTQRVNEAVQQRGLALRHQAKIVYGKNYAPPSPINAKP